VLRPNSDAARLEGKLVAHYHAGPLGATTDVDTITHVAEALPGERAPTLEAFSNVSTEWSPPRSHRWSQTACPCSKERKSAGDGGATAMRD